MSPTADGAVLAFDAFLVAGGALPQSFVEGAPTFRGPADMERVSAMLQQVESGSVESIVFSIPGGAVWSLPGYELALLAAAWLETRGREDVSITIATPEDAPLRRSRSDQGAGTRRPSRHG